MKRYDALISILFVVLLAWETEAFAAGDLSQQTPVELRVQLGDEKGARRFFPEKVEFETGKLYGGSSRSKQASSRISSAPFRGMPMRAC